MIRESILHINRRIADVCSKINRDPAQIAIVAVAKGKTAEQVKDAVESGIIHIGENRVQEATLKCKVMCLAQYAQRIKWHMVGHLQTNKVKQAVKIFDLIQSVDSVMLASEINLQAGRINKIQDILIQVNMSGESTKFGLRPDAVAGFIKEAAGFRNINIKGLMTIAPVADNSEKNRIYFRMLRELRDRINELSLLGCQLTILSMGMSDDFDVAIGEGANMIRLGRAIFEE